jgi:hypothetical protein
MSCYRRARSSPAAVPRKKLAVGSSPVDFFAKLHTPDSTSRVCSFWLLNFGFVPATWVPVWGVQALACFVDAAPDAGPEQDEIQVGEPASIGAPAGFQDVAAAQDESPALLLDAAE